MFEKAMGHFRKKDFQRAIELFDQAAEGPVAEVAHTAQMHSKMCQRRMGQQAEPRLETPEDHYAYAVALMNRGGWQQAEPLLSKALGARPEADHYHYAMALCAGHAGDVDTAVRHLKRAIELQPSNRTAARGDAEFHALMQQHPAIREVLSAPERNVSG